MYNNKIKISQDVNIVNFHNILSMLDKMLGRENTNKIEVSKDFTSNKLIVFRVINEQNLANENISYKDYKYYKLTNELMYVYNGGKCNTVKIIELDSDNSAFDTVDNKWLSIDLEIIVEKEDDSAKIALNNLFSNNTIAVFMIDQFDVGKLSVSNFIINENNVVLPLSTKESEALQKEKFYELLVSIGLLLGLSLIGGLAILAIT